MPRSSPFTTASTRQVLTRISSRTIPASSKRRRSATPSSTRLSWAPSQRARVPFTALCAWLRRRRKPRWVLDQSPPCPWSSRPSSWALPSSTSSSTALSLYGTLLSVIIASAVRYLPYGMRYAYAGVLQIHRELEEASSLPGRPGIDLPRDRGTADDPGDDQLLAVRLPAGGQACRCRSCSSARATRSSPSRCSTCGRTARSPSWLRWADLDGPDDGRQRVFLHLARRYQLAV